MDDKANAPYPYLGINGEYFSKEFLEEVENDLQRKAILLWATGIEKPSPSDKFAYHVLKQIKMNGDWHAAGVGNDENRNPAFKIVEPVT